MTIFPSQRHKNRILSSYWLLLKGTLSQRGTFFNHGMLWGQSEFYHKLNLVENDCNFTDKEEIVKFLFLTHNQNTRVHEHLLKEMQDMTSMSDMLRMACVCEGTVYSEEISKQYLESIKTVKQVDAINQCQRSASANKGRGHGRGHGQGQSQS